MTKFVNEKRICGKTVEGFGEYATTWADYETKCGECGRWVRKLGDVSTQVGDNPDCQAMLCEACAEESIRLYGPGV